jgi:hypothetical protein
MKGPLIKVRREPYVRRAIAVLENRGSANPPGSGKGIAEYLNAHVEDFGDISEVRHWIRNIEQAIREFREELRGIES